MAAQILDAEGVVRAELRMAAISAELDEMTRAAADRATWVAHGVCTREDYVDWYRRMLTARSYRASELRELERLVRKSRAATSDPASRAAELRDAFARIDRLRHAGWHEKESMRRAWDLLRRCATAVAAVDPELAAEVRREVPEAYRGDAT